MDSSWTSLTLWSGALTVALVLQRPEYSIHSSYVQTFLTLFSAAAFLTTFYSVLIYPFFVSPLRKLPQPKGGSFWNGQFRKIREEPMGRPQLEWINTVPNDGLIYYRGLFNSSRILPTTPQALAEILTTKSYEFVKPVQLRKGVGRILGVGLVLAEGDEHRMQRKNLMPAFSFRHVKDLYPIFWAKSCKLVHKLMTETAQNNTEQSTDDDVLVEMGGWASRAALDIIGVAGLGQEFNALDDPNTELNATYRRVFQPTKWSQLLGFLSFVLPGWFLRNLPLDHNSNIVEASKTIRKVCRDLIAKKQELMATQDDKAVSRDILSVAIESSGFSQEDLVNQLMTFLVAGHETTATSLTWAVYQLARNPEIQLRLRQEVRQYLPPPSLSEVDIQPTLQHHVLDQCHYLSAVCSEVLRVHAPVAASMRVAATPHSTVLGQKIPKGTVIIVPAIGTNLNKSLWGADAASFDPNRWINSQNKHTGNGGAESNYAFMTFLHGPRSCIGQQFARAEFACLLGAIVGRFSFALEDPNFVPEIAPGGITSKPLGGMPVKIHAIPGW